MVKEGSIAQFMLREHGEIFVLMNDFKKNSNKDNAEDYYKKLKEKQQTHVLAEEKAIIILNDEGKKYKEVITILQQHDELEKLMRNIAEDLDRKQDNYGGNIKKFMDLMKEHVQLENIKFYPKLDKELTSNQKDTILQKLKDVILGNIRA